MNITKILLIHSAHHAANGKPVHARSLLDKLTIANVAELALPLLAAYTPSHIQVEYIDDYLDEITWDSDAEVIAISAQVMQLSRAIEIARTFRSQGKVVIMGGFLPSMHPEQVREHVDAICIGEGDTAWTRILTDIENDCLKPVYVGEPLSDLSSIPVPRYDLIRNKRFVSYPIQATRGCPYSCDYCSIVQVYKSYRTRPVDNILRDIRAIPGKYIHFTDDNLMENKNFSTSLFQGMIGSGKLWGAQVTINVARNENLLKLAWQSGCRMLAIGMESLSQNNLQKLQKDFTKVKQFDQSIRAVQDAGIGLHALIVFGLPEDDESVFDETVNYLHQQAVAIAEFFIFTPYPGTPEGQRILKEGRITDHNLSHYRECYVVFDHPTLSHQQLVDGYWRALKKFYSLKSILSRIWRGSFKNKWLHLFNNLNYWIKIKRGIVPVYFGRGN